MTSPPPDSPAPSFHWVSPRAPALDECDFYHSLTLPGGEVTGQWDLRHATLAYLGGIDFAGRSVIEIGPASGFLSFFMEKAGARVSCVEPPMSYLWDAVPHGSDQVAHWRENFASGIARLRNSFWYCHRLYRSNVRVLEAHPYHLPEEAGNYEIGLLASVLLHVREPFSLIESVARRVTQTMVITEVHYPELGAEPVCRFMPHASVRQFDTWWQFSPQFFASALELLGFSEIRLSFHRQRCVTLGEDVPMFTLVAEKPRNPQENPRAASGSAATAWSDAALRLARQGDWHALHAHLDPEANPHTPQADTPPPDPQLLALLRLLAAGPAALAPGNEAPPPLPEGALHAALHGAQPVADRLLEIAAALPHAPQAFQTSLLEAALALHPAHAATWLHLAWHHYAQARLQEALDAAGQALQLSTDPAQRPEICSALAWFLLEKGELDAAGELLAQALAQAPHHPGLHWHLGNLHFKKGQLAQASQSLSAALSLDPDLDEAAASLAWVLHDQGRFLEASLWARRALNQKRTPERLAQLGWLLLLLGKTADAIAALTQALQLAPQTLTTYLHLSRALKAEARPREALEQLEAGLKRFPDSPELMLAAAWLHRDLHDAAQAQTLAGRVADAQPECASAWHLLGIIAHDEGRSTRAATCLARALDLDGSIADAAIRLATLLRRERRFDEARQAVTQALTQHREHAALLGMQALLLLDLDLAADARRHLHQALRHSPADATLWLRLAQALLKLGRRITATQAVRRALRYAPDMAEAWSLDAWLALEDKRLPAARHALQQLIALTPDSPDTHTQAAFILAACGEIAAAAAHAESAVAQQAESAEAWRALGQVRHVQGRLREAEAALHNALSLEPQPATHCLRQLGWILRSAGRLDEACCVFSQALAAAPDDPVCLYELAELASLTGETEKARQALDKALALRPAWPPALRLRARILRDLGTTHWPEAIALCTGLLLRREEIDTAAALLMEFAALGDARASQALRLLPRQERLHLYRSTLGHWQAVGHHAAYCGLAALAHEDFPENTALAISALHAGTLCDKLAPPALSRELRLWQRRLAMHAGLNRLPAPPVFRGNGKLRIAYVAAHFHRSLLMPLLAAHTFDEVDIFLYCDLSRDSLGELAGKICLQTLRGQNLAESMRANRIDVAIDTVGIHAGNGQDEVLRQFSRRLAPVQCGWLGNWAGSGGVFDYLFADERAIPASCETRYEEGIVRLPGAQWCWEAPAFAPPVSPLPCLSRKTLTLGCPVRAFRLSARTLHTWARLLARLPEARLLLLGEHGQNGLFRQELAACLAAEGVAPERVAFAPHKAYPDYLAAFAEVDIALDSFPANGGLCLLDALWMGVPVVSLAGNWLGERQGLSLLGAVGHAEWAASDENAYLDIVCSLAGDRSALARIRSTLRQEVAASPLLDGQGMARTLEAACRRLRQQAEAVVQAPSPKERYRAVAQRQFDIWREKNTRLDLAARDGLSDSPPELSVVLVLYRQAGLSRQTIAALADQAGCRFETIVVDNASGDDTLHLLDRLQGAQIVRNDENTGFLRAANQGAALARGAYLLFLNSDAVVHADALRLAVRRLDADSTIGALGARIVLADGALQEAGCIAYRSGATAGYGRGRDPQAPEFGFSRDVDFCSGAFLMVRRQLWNRLGGFDTLFAPAYYEDTDFCLRVQDAGFRVIYDPQVWLSHFEWGSASTNQDAIELMERHRERFAARHRARLAERPDPAQAMPASDRWLARRKTRILIIDNAVPHMAAGGGLPRARLLLRALSGNDLTLFPLWTTDEDWRDVHASLPDSIEVILHTGAAGLEAFLRERRGVYDYLMVSRPPNMAFVDRLWQKQPELFAGMRLVYDAEAIFALREIAEAAVAGKPLARATARTRLRDELALSRRAETVLTVSASEARLFKAAGARQVRLLAHAMATRSPTPDWSARENLLFVGAIHPDTPNEDSLLWFCREILPRINRERAKPLRLDVAGDCHSGKIAALAGTHLRLLGRVDDLEPCYDRARVFVAPTRFAAGVPAKVIEAACNGLPVVATPLLVRQLGWRAGHEILAAGDAAGFAHAVLSLYENEARWLALRTAMQERTQDSYSPDDFSRTLQRVFSPVGTPEGSRAQSTAISDKSGFSSA